MLPENMMNARANQPDELAEPAANSRRRLRILLIVENVSLARDHRLQKQAATLVSAGYHVGVICRRDPGNHTYGGGRVHDYRAPADAESKFGFVPQYGLSLIIGARLTPTVFLTQRVVGL